VIEHVPETPRPEALDHPAEPSAERTTRKPLALWDRLKFLILGAVLFGFFVWSDAASNPILPLADAFQRQLEAKWWILALMGVEAVRQLHYLRSERSPRWHAFWTQRVFGRVSGRTEGWDPWTRFRLGRVLKVIVAIVVLDLILANVFDLSPATALAEAPARLFSLLPFLLQAVVIMTVAVGQFAAIFWFLSRGGVDVYMPEDIETRFTDVWGQDAVLQQVQENVVFLEDPESIEEKGGYVPGGILLWGPPGTGKTLMAEAVAGETGKPFVFVDPGAFINMFLGVGVLKVKSLFRKLRKLALRYGGVIVFFDEADSLGSRGGQPVGGVAGAMSGSPFAAVPSCNGLGYVSDGTVATVHHAAKFGALPAADPIIMGGMNGGGGGMGTLQALLTEISGLKKPRGFVNRHVRRALGMKPKPPPKYRMLIMMATNMPDALDEALLRPGRVDRIYKVGYPSKEGRKRTYEGYLAKVRHELTPEQVDKLAVISPHASGARIKDTVNEALILAVRDGRDTITWRDVIKSKHLKEHGLPDDAEYVERERHAVAIHEACHAVAAFRLRRHATIDIATIERRGDVGGFVSWIPEEDLFFDWRSEWETDIVVSLASLAGERMFFDGDSSAGVGGDLRNATTVALRMHGFAGMGSTMASHLVSIGGMRGAQQISDGTDRAWHDTTFGREVEGRLGELYQRAWRLLEENRLEVLAVAHALETHKTVSGEDVAAIIEGTVGPFVDGRPYHDEPFARIAEGYHERALTAHKTHASIEAPLPVFTGVGFAEPVGAFRYEPSEDGEGRP
jgi:cell division protease FtsH